MDFPRKIYVIKNQTKNKAYVGSSASVYNRKMNHFAQLRSGKHTVEDMQNDFNDGDKFEFFIIDEIKDFSEKGKEYEWMEIFNSGERSFGYNYRDKHFNPTITYGKKGKDNGRNVVHSS